MSREFQFIVVTPPAQSDPATAIAASRAGAIGILDCQFISDEQITREALRRLAAFGRNKRGVKIDGFDEDWAARVISWTPAELSVVVFTGCTPGFLEQQIRLFHKRDVTVLLECTTHDQARTGERLGVDGLIAKGNEAAGSIGEETTFVLLQRTAGSTSLPVWAHGGVGLHGVAACYAAGAAGAVLDGQLWLTRECSLPAAVKDCIRRMDGSETVCIGKEAGETFRVYAKPGAPEIDQLRKELAGLTTGATHAEKPRIWGRTMRARTGWDSGNIWLLGQDAAFASSFAQVTNREK